MLEPGLFFAHKIPLDGADGGGLSKLRGMVKAIDTADQVKGEHCRVKSLQAVQEAV